MVTKKINKRVNKLLEIKFRIVIVLVSLIAIAETSCKKLAEVDAPFTSTNAGTVYSDDIRATAVLTGLYTLLSSGSPVTGNNSISLYSGLSADELTLYSPVSDVNLKGYYQNALVANASSSIGSDFWSPLYNYIFTCNAAVEGLSTSSSLTPAIKQQLLGEAKFMRAYFYFYLVNLFGDVPLILSTDYKENSQLARAPKSQIYKQIIADLNDAKDLLSTDYLDGNLQTYSGTPERVRPTKWSATALLARVYLYNGNLTGDASNYANAESQATSVINNILLYDIVSLNNVFLKNNKEAIWQLQPVKSGRNTEDAQTFILTSSGPTNNTSRPVYSSPQLLNSFENGDLRKVNWVDSIIATGTGVKYFFPAKYKNRGGTVTEYFTVLRLAEQYLIRAEARAQLGNISGAQADINKIRSRAGLTNTTANDKPSLLTTILHERQVELFTESGHRWMDIKRTNNVDAIMNMVTPLKANGAPWKSYQQYYPILQTDIITSPNLTQTPGYQ